MIQFSNNKESIEIPDFKIKTLSNRGSIGIIMTHKSVSHEELSSRIYRSLSSQVSICIVFDRCLKYTNLYAKKTKLLGKENLNLCALFIVI